MLDALCARFPAIPRERWNDRFARGRVLDLSGVPIAADASFRVGAQIYYYREVDTEMPVPFAETVRHSDAHLVVADKPHFLAVTPAGGRVEETLLARLIRRLDNPDLVPLHRIDRETAGLVMFSANRSSRSRYQALFREHRIDKRYEALAAPLPELDFPYVHRSRLARGEPFFRTREVDGVANSQTLIDVLDRGEHCWRYALRPITGRQHQLRVHMASLGAPILNDRCYPLLAAAAPDEFSLPLQLLARSLAFIDPIDGTARRFESGLMPHPID